MQAFYTLMRLAYILTWPLTGLLLHNSERVRVMVVRGDELLLQKTSYGKQLWSLPGGGVDRSESYIAAATRELAEETGIHIDGKELELLGRKRLPYSRFGWPKVNVTFFFVEIKDEGVIKVTRPFEIAAIGWFKLSDLPKDLSQSVLHAQALRKKL